MTLDLAALPDDADALRAIVAAQAAALAGKDAALATRDAELAAHRLLVDWLRLQLARLRRKQFGRCSERLAAEAEQLELVLRVSRPRPASRRLPPPGTTLTGTGRRSASRLATPCPTTCRAVVTHAAPQACPARGGSLRPLGDDVTEVLDYVPGRFRVVRHVRPKCSCRACEAVAQAPAPALPIHRGRATAALLAHVLVAKYADHLPLYRQYEIYARDGVALERSTLADWVGHSARPCCARSWTRWSAASWPALRPLRGVDRLCRSTPSGGIAARWCCMRTTRPCRC